MEADSHLQYPSPPPPPPKKKNKGSPIFNMQVQPATWLLLCKSQIQSIKRVKLSLGNPILLLVKYDYLTKSYLCQAVLYIKIPKRTPFM